MLTALSLGAVGGAGFLLPPPGRLGGAGGVGFALTAGAREAVPLMPLVVVEVEGGGAGTARAAG